MTDNYQLAEDSTKIAFEKEITNGTDPATTRIRHPGYVRSSPAPTENYLHEGIKAASAGPDPLAFVKTGEDFEVEFESNLQDSFAGDDDYFSMMFGSLKHVFVTHDAPSGPGFDTGEGVTGTPSGAVGIIGLLETDAMHILTTSGTFASGDTLTGVTSGTTAASASAPVTSGLVTLERPLPSFVQEWGYDPDPTGSGPPRWLHLLEGSKFTGWSLALRSEATIRSRSQIWGRIHTALEQEIQASSVKLSELTHNSTNPPARWKDLTLTFKQVPSGTPISVTVLEMDVSFENNLERIKGDIGQFFASHLGEGDRGLTVDFRTKKIDNLLWDISRGDPFEDAGVVDFTLEIDVPNGWYMKLEIPRGALTNRAVEKTDDSTQLEETFSITAQGDPAFTINFQRPI